MSAVAREKPKRRATPVAVVGHKAAKVTGGQGRTMRRLAQLANQADAGETVKLARKSDDEILKAIFG